MGIKDLLKYARKRGYKDGKIIDIAEMRGSKVAVDVSIWAYRAKNAESETNKYPIIRYFLRMIHRFVTNNIYPVFVFDGKSPKMKMGELHKREKKAKDQLMRYERNEDAIKKIEVLMSDDDVLLDTIPERNNNVDSEKYTVLLRKRKKYLQSLNKPKKEDYDLLKAVLDSMFIPYIVIDHHDAEHLCSYLQAHGKVKWIMSSDTDCLVIPGVTGIIHGYKNNIDQFDIHYKKDIMDALGFHDERQLLNYAVLLGGDYNDRIYREGMIKSWKFITNSHDCGEEIARKKHKNYDDIIFMFTYDFYQNPSDVEDVYYFIDLTNKVLFTIMKCDNCPVKDDQMIMDILANITIGLRNIG